MTKEEFFQLKKDDKVAIEFCSGHFIMGTVQGWEDEGLKVLTTKELRLIIGWTQVYSCDIIYV
jgi:hypothetical protein